MSDHTAIPEGIVSREMLENLHQEAKVERGRNEMRFDAIERSLSGIEPRLSSIEQSLHKIEERVRPRAIPWLAFVGVCCACAGLLGGAAVHILRLATIDDYKELQVRQIRLEIESGSREVRLVDVMRRVTDMETRRP